MNTGIYRIRIGDWFYIGQAKNFKTRWMDHTSGLKANRHDNSILQRAYNKYQTIEFDILAYCTEDKLNSMEQSIIDAYIDEDNCANMVRIAGSPMRGRKHSEESRAKMSAFQKDRVRPKEEVDKRIAAMIATSGRGVTVEDSLGIHLFESVSEAARYLGCKTGTLWSSLVKPERKRRICQDIKIYFT